jgi:hypothetical protein
MVLAGSVCKDRILNSSDSEYSTVTCGHRVSESGRRVVHVTNAFLGIEPE